MDKMRWFGTLVAISAVSAFDAAADPVRYTADRWHTRIYFDIDHMGLSNYGGRFTEFDIDFLFDEEDFSKSSVEVRVPVASIDTFSPELNEKMPGVAFFDAADHPVMHFRSTKIEQLDSSRARMTGDLTIRGVTLPVIFDVTMNGKVLHPFYNLHNIGFSATGSVDSRAYGVNRLPEWMLASMVNVRIELEAFEGDSVPYYDE